MKQKHLHILAVLLALLLPCITWASLKVDDTFEVNGLTYKVTSISPNEVQVGAQLGTPATNNFDVEGVINIPSSVMDPDGKSYSVTGIGPSAFASCKKLTEVKIPKSVTTIGTMAFEGCSGITSITLPDGLKSIASNAFSGCTSLVSVAIPKGITNVEHLIFSGCTSLTTVVCGSNLGATAFNGCTALTDVTFTEGVTIISKAVFQDCSSLRNVTIPSTVTSIGYGAFQFCTSLANVTLPEGLESIGESAFYECISLQSIVIPSSVKEIGRSAFRRCDALTAIYIDMDSWCRMSVGDLIAQYEDWYKVLYLDHIKATEITDLIIPEGVTKLSDNVFNILKNLKSVTFPASMTDFSSLNFEKCTSLNAIHIKDLKVWLNTKFEGIAPVYRYNPLYYAKHLFVNDTEVKDLVIPEGVSVINDFAFYGCEGLTSVTFPEGVTTIGSFAFSGCTGLTSVTIPKSLTYIGGRAFSGCTALNAVHISDVAAWCAIPFLDSKGSNPLALAGHLFMNGQEVKDLVIPEGVTSIGAYAFYGCTDLTSVTIPTTLRNVGEEAFDYNTSLSSVHIKDLAAWCKIEYGTTTAFPSYATSNPLYCAKHLYINGQEVTDLVIPEEVSTISNFAFKKCEGLTSINIGNSVTSIGEYAFENCPNVRTITIGSAVKSIGKLNFYGCKELLTVYSLIEEPFELSDYLFKYVDETTGLKFTSATLYVPVGTKAKYMATDGWKEFKNIVEMEPEPKELVVGDSFEADGITYKVTSTSPREEVQIGDGREKDIYNSTSGEFVIPASVIGLDGKTYYGTKIGEYAFEYCEDLTKVTIPNSVTSIGNSAFSGCSSLSSIVIPSSVTSIGDRVFSSCHSLNSISIPNSVTTIGTSAFGACSLLTSITLPNSLKRLEDYTFAGCESLVSVTTGNSLEYIGERAFYNCKSLTSFTIPESVASIGNQAFRGCRSIYQITSLIEEPYALGETTFLSVPDDATLNVPAGTKAKYEVLDGWKAFNNIVEMEPEKRVWQDPVSKVNYEYMLGESYASVKAGDFTTSGSPEATGDIVILNKISVNGVDYTVNDIGAGAFNDCRTLTSVAIPNTIESIQSGAFSNCRGLTSVTIPNSVKFIGSYAFEICESLTSVFIPNSVARIKEGVFRNCGSLSSITVGNGNTVYDSRGDCNAIIETKSNEIIAGCKNTVIPATIQSIGDLAFYGCFDLTSIAIPNSVTSIGKWAFCQCGLISITIPNSVANIGENAFTANLSLVEVFSMIEDPFVINAFNAIGNDATLYVPVGTKAKYEATDGWKEFTHIVEMVENDGISYDIKEDGKLVVKGVVDGEETKVVIPDKIEIDGKEYVISVIAADAFKDNTDMISVTIPESIEEIGANAFAGCTNLKEIHVLSPTPIAFSAAAARGLILGAKGMTVSQFDGVDFDTCILYVPFGSEQAYGEAEGWREFKHIVGVHGETDPTLTVTAKNYTREYGEENPTFEFTTEGATLDGEPVIECEATATSGVGTYDIVIKKGSVKNYNDSYVNGTLTITKAPLTVKVGSYTKKQGEDNPEFTLTYEGFKNDETSEVLTKQPVVTTEAVKGTEPGKYEITVSGAEAENYDINYVMGELTVIDADAIVLTAKSYTREYGEENPSFEFTTEGATLDGEPVIECEATATSAVGTYDIVIKKGGVTNYNDSYVNGTLTITKALLTVKVGSYAKKQGEDNPEFTITYEGFKNDETSEVLTKQPVVTTEAVKEAEPGKYEITVNGAEAENYDINYVMGELTVTDADAIILTAKSYTREYGEENPTFEFTTEGATLDGEPVIECEAMATSGVGTYDIVIKKGSVKNYNDSYVNGTLTITKAPLTVSVKDVEREQGEDNPQFEIVYSGWKLQDTESVLRKKPVATTKATKDSPVGEYVITVSGGEAENYELKYQNGKLIVTVPSGISNVTDGRPFDVYTVTGRKVCHQVTTLKGLPKGVYIVNGKKVVKN